MISLGFTRPPQHLKESIELAESLGFSVTAAPSLEAMAAEAEVFNEFCGRCKSGEFHFIIFSSATAVRFCREALDDDFDNMCKRSEIIAIGPGTWDALRKAGISPDLMPKVYSSEGLTDMLDGAVEGKKILVVRSDKGSKVLDVGLVSAGAESVTLTAYTLKPCDACEDTSRLIRAMDLGELDALAFTSPMSVMAFHASVSEQLGPVRADECIGRQFIATIGEPTAEALRGMGKAPDLVAGNATFLDMLLDIKAHFDV